MSDEGRAGGCGVVVREARAVQCETHMRRGAACATALGAGGSSCPSDVGACLRAVEPPHCRLLCHVTVSALGHTLYVNGMWRYPEIQTRSLSPRRRDPLRSTVRRALWSVYGLSRGTKPAKTRPVLIAQPSTAQGAFLTVLSLVGVRVTCARRYESGWPSSDSSCRWCCSDLWLQLHHIIGFWMYRLRSGACRAS